MENIFKDSKTLMSNMYINYNKILYCIVICFLCIQISCDIDTEICHLRELKTFMTNDVSPPYQYYTRLCSEFNANDCVEFYTTLSSYMLLEYSNNYDISNQCWYDVDQRFQCVNIRGEFLPAVTNNHFVLVYNLILELDIYYRFLSFSCNNISSKLY